MLVANQERVRDRFDFARKHRRDAVMSRFPTARPFASTRKAPRRCSQQTKLEMLRVCGRAACQENAVLLGNKSGVAAASGLLSAIASLSLPVRVYGCQRNRFNCGSHPE